MLHHRSIWLGAALSIGLTGCSLFSNPVAFTNRPSLNAYLSLPAEDTVSVVSLTEKKSVGSIKVGDNPVNLAINSRANLEYLYTANQNDGTVSFVNLRSGELEQPVQSGSQPWGIDITPYMKLTGTETMRQWIVVANTGDNTISYIDPTSRAMSIKQSSGFRPHGVVANPTSLETFIISDTGPNCQVLRIAADGTVGQATPITGSQRLWKGAITPDGKTLYITDQGTTNLYKVDISNGQFSVQQPIPLSGQGYDIAISPNGKTAYVSIPNGGGSSADAQGLVEIYDLTTGSRTGSKPINQRVQEANRPQALAVNAAGTELWIAMQNRLGYYGLNSTSGDMGDDLRIAPYTTTPGQAPPISDIVLGAGVQ